MTHLWFPSPGSSRPWLRSGGPCTLEVWRGQDNNRTNRIYGNHGIILEYHGNVGITWDYSAAVEHFIAYLGSKYWLKGKSAENPIVGVKTSVFGSNMPWNQSVQWWNPQAKPAESGDESETLGLCGQVCWQLFSFPHESLSCLSCLSTALAALAGGEVAGGWWLVTGQAWMCHLRMALSSSLGIPSCGSALAKLGMQQLGESGGCKKIVPCVFFCRTDGIILTHHMILDDLGIFWSAVRTHAHRDDEQLSFLRDLSQFKLLTIQEMVSSPFPDRQKGGLAWYVSHLISPFCWVMCIYTWGMWRIPTLDG